MLRLSISLRQSIRKKRECAAPTMLIVFLIVASLAFAQDRLRRNFAWTFDGGNDPILQVKNEWDQAITVEVRLMLEDAIYRYPVDLEVPSGESRFLRVRELIDRLVQRHNELKSATSGSLQIQCTGENDSVKTTLMNLNPKLGVTSDKGDSPSVPKIITLQPSNGNPEGGTVVRIVGENFTEATAVRFGGLPALHDLQSPGILIAVTPPHSPGLVDVEVANGKNKTRFLHGFRYEQQSPVIVEINPDTGPPAGGVRAIIRGRNFEPNAKVLWDDRPIPTRFVSPVELGITIPPGKRGTIAIGVQNPTGGKFVLEDAFHYEGAPRVISVQPRMGTAAGGYTVTVTGENFEPGCSVLIGTHYAPTTFVNPRTLAAIVPQGESGNVNISVTTENGEVDTLESAFLYNDPPVIYSVSAVPDPIVRNTTTTITVEANDPEAGELNFEYRIARGSGHITGQGKTAVYYSPNMVETAVIQVTVYDENGAKAQENLEIHVE